ncbi:MAG: hypothetical protein ACFFA8_14180 [Promethearchaeota archaeon]
MKPEEIASIALDSNVKTLVLTHFDASIFPSIESREKSGKKARKIFNETLIAKDGFEMIL